jgi:hypothetical protein
MSTQFNTEKFSHLCPRLTDQEQEKINFQFDDEFYTYFNNFIFNNPGKTTKELVSLIDVYPFTEESLELAFKLFNTYKCTFKGVGPFIFKEGMWFPVYKKKYTDNLILAAENSKLRKEVKNLQQIISELNHDSK